MSNNEKEEQIEKANSEQLKEELDQNLDNTQNDKLIATQEIFESGEDTEEEVHIDIDIDSYQRNLIEGALYASGEPLTVEELYTRLDISKPDVQKYLDQLVEEYNKRTTALTIVHIGEKYQMQIKSEYTDPISQFAEGGGMAEKYLRTLTIIALKQPILKSTLVKIRGSGAYEHVQYLEDNGFIDSVKKGRTSELTTTEKYAETFSLPKNVDDMKKEMISKLGIDDK
ncbi:MAG: SMC-Scp complex subunit ScpB [Candidatus Lokiarchaeota archaeon]|nr:SMC-Scp complex subunit ScpB [Candidatus Lokiarchaeota archaeon]